MHAKPVTALFYLILMLAIPQPAMAAPETGSPAPAMSISDRGELMLVGDKVEYQPWALQTELGKVHVVNYMAGTLSASKLNEAFTDRLQTEFELGSYHVTTIINLDDATWGTTGFVVGEVKSNKRKHPRATLVLDEESSGRDAWSLDADSSAIFVLDPGGTIRYGIQGAMSEQDIDSTVELMRGYITGPVASGDDPAAAILPEPDPAGDS